MWRRLSESSSETTSPPVATAASKPTNAPPTTAEPTTTIAEATTAAPTTAAPTTAAPTTAAPTTVTEPPTTVATTVAAPAGPITRQWHDLMSAHCLPVLPTGSFVSVETVDCATPHAAEVFFAGRADPLRPTVAEERCLNAFPGYTGIPFDGSGYEITWIESEPNPSGEIQLGDFNADVVVCLLSDATGNPLTGSVAA